MISSYKELAAYKKSYQLVILIFKLTSRFPKEEVYGLSTHMRRSVISIPSNIAEGYMRGSREYFQFLKIALGSAAELETQLSLAKDLGFCQQTGFEEAYQLNEEVIKLLRSYLRKMSRKNSE